MTLTNLHSHPPPDDPDPQAKGRIIVSHVRMNITQKEGVKTLSIPSTLHKILNSIRDVDNKVTFEDIQRKSFSLETFPSDKAKLDQAFGTVIKDGRSTQVILGFTIKSSNTLVALKQPILPVLQRCSTFLRPHLSNMWERLDTITIGHLHLVHPTIADAKVLKQKIKIQLQETVDRIHTTPEYHDTVHTEIEHDDHFISPELMFSPGRALGHLDNHEAASDVMDVYLERHRNIGLVAITTDAMHHQKVKDIDGKEWTSMYAALSNGPGIAQINATKRTYDLGKWNFSTTHDTWESAKAWLDRHLLPLYHSIPTDVRNTDCSFGDFTEPQRL
jgi:hypothetical protein